MPEILSAVAPAPAPKTSTSFAAPAAEPQEAGAGNEFRDAMRKAVAEQDTEKAPSSESQTSAKEAAPAKETAADAANAQAQALPVAGTILPLPETLAPHETPAAAVTAAATTLTQTAATSEAAAALVQSNAAGNLKTASESKTPAATVPVHAAAAHVARSETSAELPVTTTAALPAQPAAAATQAQPVVWDADLIRASKEIMQTAQPGERAAPFEGMTSLSALTSQVAAARAPAPSAPLSTAVDVGFRQPGWDDAFASRVAWTVKQDVQNAEIRLNPAHLGPVEIKISMHQDQASVTLSAHHASVREAMESAIPRLREMLADSGINLANVNVAQQFSGHDRRTPQHPAQEGFAGSGNGAHAEGEAGTAIPATALKLGAGVLDLYA